jgi:hypothetical protein
VRSARVLGKGAAVTRAAREALRDPGVAGAALRGPGVAGATLRDPGVAGATSRDPDVSGAARREPRVVSAGGGGRPIEPDAEPIFVLCDGDLGESAARLGALADTVARGDADVAVAAFATRVGGGFGLALGFARWAIRRRTGMETGAPISGQRALRRSALEDALPLAHGFGMEIGMTIDALRAGHRLVELELELEHRASARTPAGFVHRGHQLVDFVRAYLARR